MTQDGRLVACVGIVPPETSGVHDYGRLLAEALRQRGIAVTEHWFVSDERRLRNALLASVRVLRLAMRLSAGDTALWHYSPFAYAARGAPLIGVLFGLVVRLRGGRVVTILHELAYEWQGGWRKRLVALTQWLALRVVLLGSGEVVVTTEQRAVALGRVRAGRGRVVHVLPVFSTIGADSAGAEPPDGTFTIGVLGHSGDGVRPDLLVDALSRLGSPKNQRILLLGSPGRASPSGRSWEERARRADPAVRVEFSGILSTEDLAQRVRSCHVIALVNEEGPSSRKTTLAGALAHGMPTVSLDGPNRWDDVVESGAVLVVPPDPEALANALVELRRSPERRRELGRRGRAFYHQHMSIDHASEAVARLILG